MKLPVAPVMKKTKKEAKGGPEDWEEKLKRGEIHPGKQERQPRGRLTG